MKLTELADFPAHRHPWPEAAACELGGPTPPLYGDQRRPPDLPKRNLRASYPERGHIARQPCYAGARTCGGRSLEMQRPVSRTQIGRRASHLDHSPSSLIWLSFPSLWPLFVTDSVRPESICGTICGSHVSASPSFSFRPQHPPSAIESTLKQIPPLPAPGCFEPGDGLYRL